MKRSHPRDTAYTLLQPRRGPRNVEVNDDLGVLKIHSFAQQVRRKKQIDLLGAWWRFDVRRARRESSESLIAREPASRDESSSSA
jgi:hypothetical protein